MVAHDEGPTRPPEYPVKISVLPALEGRNRLTTAFRFFLAIPHILLVGGPIAIFILLSPSAEDGWYWGGSGGALGAAAGIAALISWFAIVFTGRLPAGLGKLMAYYLRWRVRAVVYQTLLRDEYPPFGDGSYPAELVLQLPEGPRNRVSVAFRWLLVLPHLFVLTLLGMAWAFTTAVAWVVIIFTGRYPEVLYGFAVGVLAWGTRVEAYMLLLRDEYPPFTLRV